MKRTLLLFAGLLIGLTAASATEQNNQKQDNHLDITKRYRYAQPITFMERGIEFLIFPDGSFDFNTNNNTSNAFNTDSGYYDDDVFYKNNSKRGSVNATYRGPNVNIQFSSNRADRGVSIIRDRDGKVRRIGNVFLNYDRYGNITRAGSVFINYSRGKNAVVTQIGGLKVNYNRWGEIVSTRGYVNWNNRNTHYDVRPNYDRDNNHYDNDDNYYYYKQNGKVKTQKKNKR
ncbi:hypothetical protein SAMN05428642_102240 [Flaviramulus basaltis]|uniref:Uncharacterized protein n=1 Tax=Flaviramulus basaltis TaxID=369401 RepID=A0A1K2IHC7_9FLAO|nr:hypothetical protein [Flaviramulus basaltis]SFZ91702.1 hypothetical protein SAMN05428642_102240 [Flaviramulus basaltis]